MGCGVDGRWGAGQGRQRLWGAGIGAAVAGRVRSGRLHSRRERCRVEEHAEPGSGRNVGEFGVRTRKTRADARRADEAAREGGGGADTASAGEPHWVLSLQGSAAAQEATKSTPPGCGPQEEMRTTYQRACALRWKTEPQPAGARGGALRGRQRGWADGSGGLPQVVSATQRSSPPPKAQHRSRIFSALGLVGCSATQKAARWQRPRGGGSRPGRHLCARRVCVVGASGSRRIDGKASPRSQPPRAEQPKPKFFWRLGFPAPSLPSDAALQRRPKQLTGAGARAGRAPQNATGSV